MTGLLLLSGGCALLDWFAVGSGRRKIELVTKPATLLLLLAWFVLATPRPWTAMSAWLAAGLALSLVGDIFLLFSERWFLYGVGAFLLAQLAYVVALNSEGPIFSARSGLTALALIALGVLLLARLRQGLRARGRERMMFPLAIYLAGISAMVWSAACATLRPAWPTLAAGLVAIGGSLFYASDITLAWNRFIQPFAGARLLTRVTYHLGQFGLAVGVMLALLG